MKIPFHLNDEFVEIDTMPHRRATDLLRESFQIRSIHHLCSGKGCGSCLILLNNNLVHSCFIPAFELRFKDVWTVEGISSRKEFKDLAAGFDQAGARLCSFCAPSRTLVAETLLQTTLHPNAEQLRSSAEAVRCGCVSTLRIIDGFAATAEFRRKRLHV